MTALLEVRGLAVNYGQIIACGEPDAIRSNEQVIEAYLGRDDGEGTP